MSTVRYRNRTRRRARGAGFLVWMLLIGSAFGLLFGNMAYAGSDQSTPTGATACVQNHCHNVSLFNEMDTKASNASSSWLVTITGLVSNTFWILAVIEICWAAAVWVYEKDSLNSLAIEVIKKIMFIGFFYTLLLNAPAWIPTIVGSFSAVGQQAAHAPNLSTDYIIAVGLATCDMIMGNIPHLTIINIWGNIPKLLVAALCCFGILICFVLIAAEYFTAVMESYILFAAGAVFLGLGSSTWTKDYVTKYLNYAISVGVRLLIMMLCWALFSLMTAGQTFTWNYGPMLEQLGISILKAMFFLKASDMASALMNGSGGINHSAVSGAVGSTVNAVNTTQQLAQGFGAGAALKAAMHVASNAPGVLGKAAQVGGSAVAGAAAAAKHGAVRGAMAAYSFGKAAQAGKQIAQQDGKSGAAAMLSGLGKATREVAKNVPGSVKNALSPGGGHGSSPGLFQRASESLTAKAAAGRTNQP